MGMVKGIVAGVAACALVASAAWAEEITTLTINEQVGAARTMEPIRMGVPPAKGVAKEVGELSLADESGKPIPSQFVEVMRRPDDNSLRRVHVIFQASVAAKGKTTVKLMKAAPAAGAGKVEVTEGDGGVAVTNGVLKLTVKGVNFNLFDSVSYDPTGALGPGTEIVKPHAEGVVAMIDGKAHTPGADSKVVVEEKGPEGAVIKASGKLVANGDGPFEFVCRIHVFRASPVVKVDFSYTNVNGKVAADKVMLEDLSVVLPTALAGAKATVGAEPGVKSGTAAKIVARNSDLSELTVAGADAGTAKGKSTKPYTIGWGDLMQGQKGIAVGVRWFWQMFPKAMEATADGKLRAGLYAKEVGKPLEVYMGQARTHYLTFLFHGAMADADLSTFFAGSQMPLRAVASPKYYCRDAQGFGLVADADPSIFPADAAEAMKKFDEAVKGSALYIEKKIDGHTFQGVTLDSCGYYAWGDVFHWASQPSDPWNTLWESNYYD